MKTLGVGLVGLDHWYSAIPLAEGVARNEATRLVGVADAEAGRAEEVGAKWGAERVVTDWRALVESDEVDIVMSFVSVDKNAAVCLAAAEAGKHIVSNKPLALTLEQANGVLSAVRKSGVFLVPAESRQRLGPRVQFAKAWYRDGRLGTLCSAAMSVWAGIPQRWPGDHDPGWFVDPLCTVGGAFVDHAVYQFDQLRWILGQEVASVVGTKANRCYEELAVEDYGSAVAVFSGGLVAALEDTWTAPLGAFQSSCRLVGSAGALDMNGITGRQLLIGESLPVPGWLEAPQPAIHDQASDIGYVVDLVRGEREPVATVEDAWRNLAACLAFYKSAATGRVVAPAELPL